MSNLKIWNYLSVPWVSFVLIFYISFFSLAFFNEVDAGYISNKYLIELISNTFFLSVFSSIIAALIAVPLALIVSFYTFPGSRFFNWGLSLTIAFPVYVYAFIFVGIFEYSSPIAEFLRAINLNLPPIKNMFGSSMIMAMALFPYIFLITKAQLTSVGFKVFKAAKSLGDTNVKAIFKIILPSLIPTILAGMILVIFETISDFGGVTTLRIDTFTVGIYDAWFGYQSYFSAARLASYLLLIVFFIMFLSKYFLKGNSVIAASTAESFQKIQPSKKIQFLFSSVCSFIFFITFCVPFIQLIIWSLSSVDVNIYKNFYLLLNSLMLGILASLITVLIAITLSLGYRGSKYLRPLISIATSGYAIPGSVISAGLLIGFYSLYGSSLTIFGIYGLLLCLVLRFLTPAFNYISSSLSNISASSENALRMQPINSFKAFSYFYFPHIKKSIFLSVMIVFIETVKEQPATLLLRPVGFDTLSTRIYNFTSEGQWEMAAHPSILLVLLSFVFVYLINQNLDFKKGS